MTLCTVYCKIQSLYKSFDPVILDSTKSISNLQALEDAVAKFPGSDYQKHLSDCLEHAFLTSRQINDAKNIMYDYIVAVGSALERQYTISSYKVQY